MPRAPRLRFATPPSLPRTPLRRARVCETTRLVCAAPGAASGSTSSSKRKRGKVKAEGEHRRHDPSQNKQERSEIRQNYRKIMAENEANKAELQKPGSRKLLTQLEKLDENFTNGAPERARCGRAATRPAPLNEIGSPARRARFPLRVFAPPSTPRLLRRPKRPHRRGPAPAFTRPCRFGRPRAAQ